MRPPLFVVFSLFAAGGVFLFSCSQSKNTGLEAPFLPIRNKLSFPYIISENCFASDCIRIALEKGYFDQSFAIMDINITAGNIELRGRNGSLILWPNNKYSIKTAKDGWCSEKFNFFSGIYFEHDLKFCLRPRIVTALFKSTKEIEHFYSSFKHANIDPDNFTIEYKADKDASKEFYLVEIELIKSHDFIGDARLFKRGNVYDDTGGIEWIFRLFYNPPR